MAGTQKDKTMKVPDIEHNQGSPRIIPASPNDAGCWIGSHHGQYAIQQLVQIALEHGHDRTSELVSIATNSEYYQTLDMDILADIANELESWLNEYVAPNGYLFGWDIGEFYLLDNETWKEI